MNTNPRRADPETIENLKRMLESGGLHHQEYDVIENLVKEFEAANNPHNQEERELAYWLWDNCSDKEYGYKPAPWLECVSNLKSWLKAHGWRHD